MKAAAGEVVGIVYDWRGPDPPPGEGDLLRSKSGRRYLIVSSRKVRTRRSPCRMKIAGLVLEEGEVVEGETRVFPLVWNARKRVR